MTSEQRQRNSRAAAMLRAIAEEYEQGEDVVMACSVVSEWIHPQDWDEAYAGAASHFKVGVDTFPELSDDEAVDVLEDGVQRIREAPGDERALEAVKVVH